MKFKFAPKVVGAIFSTALIFGLAACSSGDDNKSNPAAPSGNDSQPLPPQEQVTPQSPITFNTITITPNSDKSKFLIGGGASLNTLDTNVIPTGVEVAFTDVYLTLGKVSETGQLMTTPLTITFNKPAGTFSVVNFSAFGTAIVDNNKSDCGTFRITATYKATYDMNKPDMFISRDSIDFIREQKYCEEEKSTVPEQTTNPASSVELTHYEITVDTKSGTGISFATGQTAPNASADIYLTATDDGEITVHASNGTKITAYSNANDKNWDDDWTYEMLPAEPAHMSDFRFKELSLGTLYKPFDGFAFVVATTSAYNATTGDGFYAFTMKDKTTPDANGNMNVTILVYKKK